MLAQEILQEILSTWTSFVFERHPIHVKELHARDGTSGETQSLTIELRVYYIFCRNPRKHGLGVADNLATARFFQTPQSLPRSWWSRGRHFALNPQLSSQLCLRAWGGLAHPIEPRPPFGSGPCLLLLTARNLSPIVAFQQRAKVLLDRNLPPWAKRRPFWSESIVFFVLCQSDSQRYEYTRVTVDKKFYPEV